MKATITRNGNTATIERVHCWPMCNNNVLLFQVDIKESGYYPKMSAVINGVVHFAFYTWHEELKYEVPVPEMTHLNIELEGFDSDGADAFIQDNRNGFLFCVLRDVTKEERDASVTLFEKEKHAS